MMFDFFCFFKQKTAYEMRISDWSSDVCSSDLLTGRRLEDCRMVVNGAGAAALACTALAKAMGMRHENVIVCDRTGPIYPGREDEIGRASWRERVCQYV